MKNIFIAGTDTGVGKTTVSVLLLKQLNSAGFKTFAIKPIASGCVLNTENKLENEDALLLQSAASIHESYERVNPLALKEPIAPHLSAKQMRLYLKKENIMRLILSSIRKDADFNIIEGAGGFCIPLNDNELYSDVVRELQLPTILVVGMRLGCLNHAILTVNNMMASDVNLIGWIANCIDPTMIALDENIDTLKQWIKQPCLGVVRHQQENAVIVLPTTFASA